MDPELKHSLDEIRVLARDSNQMLRAIRRHQWWSFITTFIFWLVVLAAPFYLYQQYVQPFVSRFSAPSATTSSGSTTTGMQKLINLF
jgi:hypothetical protein